MKSLHVNLSGGRDYDIFIQNGLLRQAGEKIKEVYKGGRIAVITDSNVKPLYAETVLESLKKAGFQVKLLDFPAGEPSKNLDTVVSLYDGLLNPDPFPVTRGDLIVALGGGVVGDMVGFAAATLLRGIPFVQIPTTLLAQVDSSVGGKVAVDLKQGKNLAGVFYQPKRVLIDPETLTTLSDRVFFDGLSEVIKYGMIRDEELFELLESCHSREELLPHMEEIIRVCCHIKKEIVERDEMDTGERMVLNFGHTLGHAYEKLGHYSTYMHGEAVACGMVSICEIGERQGRTLPGTADRLKKMLCTYGLPVEAQKVPQEALIGTLAYDKKGSGGSITLVLCERIGKAALQKVPKETFAQWVHEIV
ncbi:3-dehydroquinate synthase [Fumia xinanensis]|uniref:3-dehydroquinate synthase n=1 Tax=Fumia xinanensis TaxID=2763659 RepID=A0A926E602_9FIRM|nr:3-dehydroquinate synthase [Fumia xinanensis]MBC8560902.1 3-dehydroquinate synthase [Fumia xinanensis]